MGTLLASIKVQVDPRENASFQLFIVIQFLRMHYCTVQRP